MTKPTAGTRASLSSPIRTPEPEGITPERKADLGGGPVKLDPAGFTPGPWRLDDRAGHAGHAHLIRGLYHYIDAGCGYCLEGHAPGFTISALLSQADARLIAAAPDLVSALQEALEFVDGQVDVVDGDYGEPRPNRAMSLAQEIRQALGKAGVR